MIKFDIATRRRLTTLGHAIETAEAAVHDGPLDDLTSRREAIAATVRAASDEPGPSEFDTAAAWQTAATEHRFLKARAQREIDGLDTEIAAETKVTAALVAEVVEADRAFHTAAYHATREAAEAKFVELIPYVTAMNACANQWDFDTFRGDVDPHFAGRNYTFISRPNGSIVAVIEVAVPLPGQTEYPAILAALGQGEVHHDLAA